MQSPPNRERINTKHLKRKKKIGKMRWIDETNLLVKRASSLNIGIGIKFIGPEETDALLKLGASLLDRRASGPSGLGGGHGNLMAQLKPNNKIRSREGGRGRSKDAVEEKWERNWKRGRGERGKTKVQREDD